MILQDNFFLRKKTGNYLKTKEIQSTGYIISLKIKYTFYQGCSNI